MKFKLPEKFPYLDTAGRIAVISLLLCCLSGVLLAIPYDFTRAFQSVFDLLLFNPAASFVRNFHYWSAQLLLVSVLLHLYDHLRKSTETNISSRATWLILCLSIAFLTYEMISGFILKGDAAGMQARRIVASLLESVPLFGKMLNSAFAGQEDNWQIIYIQHVATGTLFLIIGVYEHVKRTRPELRRLVAVLAGLLLFSLFFRAPLGLPESSQLKGPWFFAGIQEMLHQTTHPGYLVVLFAALLLILFLIPSVSPNWRRILKSIFLVFSIFYLLLTILAFFIRGENWQWKTFHELSASPEQTLIFDPLNPLTSASPVSLTAHQKSESCLICHAGMKGLSESHNPAVTGCYACHGGDPFSPDKSRSHHNMFKVPGNLSNVLQTCGTQNCHREIAERITGSLMTTQSGIVAVDKFVFGETTSLNDTYHIKNEGFTAAGMHLRNLCAGCHLGNEKQSAGNPAWLERGGGCNACHLHYDKPAEESLQRMKTGSGSGTQEVHPSIDLQVSNDRCKSCHSRSGRISLSYEGWSETTLKTGEINDSIHFRVLPDERVVEFSGADVHHEKGLACIDCHGSYELMGDGTRHAHKEEAVKVSCLDCHPDGKPKTEVLGRLQDRESLMIAGLRKYKSTDRILLTAEGDRPLLNTRVDSLGNISLTGKLDGKVHPSRPVSPECNRGKSHNRLSCGSCHTAWVPQCIGCHNTFEKETPGFDLLIGQPVTGTWVEYAGKNHADPPVLGINESVGGQVVTAMPGMILTLDKASFSTAGNGTGFFRLYAPASGHTTLKRGRSCKSCHNDPLALGFGRGELKYAVNGRAGKWTFLPAFAAVRNDSLPEDAWTGFLKTAGSPSATRTYLRPFNLSEQKRILTAGSCLTCHADKSKAMVMALSNFDLALAGRKRECILPSW